MKALKTPVVEAKEFFSKRNKGCSLPNAVKFRGLTLKNRPPIEMICDCCGSGDDCCGFTDARLLDEADCSGCSPDSDEVLS